MEAVLGLPPSGQNRNGRLRKVISFQERSCALDRRKGVIAETAIDRNPESTSSLPRFQQRFGLVPDSNREPTCRHQRTGGSSGKVSGNLAVVVLFLIL